MGSTISSVFTCGPFCIFPVQRRDLQYFISHFSSIVPPYERSIIINCAAIVGRKNVSTTDPYLLRNVNSNLPFQLANLVKYTRTFLVHLSTNSVFDSSPASLRSYSTPTSSNSLYGISKILAENYILSTLNQPQFLILRTPQQYSDNYLNSRNFLSTFYQNYLRNSVNTISRKEYFSCASTLEIAYYIFDCLLSQRHGIHHCTEEKVMSWTSLAQIYKDIHNIDYICTDLYYSSSPINSTLFAPKSYSIPSRMIEFIESAQKN